MAEDQPSTPHTSAECAPKIRRITSAPVFDLAYPMQPIGAAVRREMIAGYFYACGIDTRTARVEIDHTTGALKAWIDKPLGARKPRALSGGMAAALAVRAFQEVDGLKKTPAIRAAADLLEPHSPNGESLIKQKLKRAAVLDELRRLQPIFTGRSGEGAAFILALRYWDLELSEKRLEGWVNGWLWDSTRVDAIEINDKLTVTTNQDGRSVDIRLSSAAYHTFRLLYRER